MNEDIGFWRVINNRSSVRRFGTKIVDRNVLEKVIETGTRAPNAHNRQSWRFVILTEKSVMTRLADQMSLDYENALLESGISPATVQDQVNKRKERLTGAPVVVVLCVDTADLDVYQNENRNEGEYLMAVQSAALAGGYMLLAAYALGLAGVWMCAPLFAQQKVREVLDLPDTWIAQGLLLLGHPAEMPEIRQRKELSEVTKWI